MDYVPGQDRFFGSTLNRWLGMPVKPEPGDVQPWSELLERLVPDQAARTWFEQWCAHPLQNLGAKLKSAMILWGLQQGTGKTTLSNTLMRIYGRNAIAINEYHLHAPFNAWAMDPVCLRGGDHRRGQAVNGGQQAVEIDCLKGCLRRIDEQRKLQALAGRPLSISRSKPKGKEARA